MAQSTMSGTGTITSSNASNITAAAIHDAVRIEAQYIAKSVAPLTDAVAVLDLNTIGADDARKLMSAEHKALGYRPPPGSLAAEAQAAAAKHPEAHAGVAVSVLRELAISDAARIAAERKPALGTSGESDHGGIDLEKVGEAEARTLMSAEHKALGFRPPPGSLAAEAQAAAARHPHPSESLGLEVQKLKEIALEDAARIARQRDPDAAPTVSASVDLAHIGIEAAKTIQTAEQKAPGYLSPPTSLAAAAQSATSEHPTATSTSDDASLEAAVIADNESAVMSGAGYVGGVNLSEVTVTGVIDLDTITCDEARELQSEEQRILGYRPPTHSIAAEAQAAVARRDAYPVTQ